MILRFTVANWRSFRDPATFSLTATRERQHGERLRHVAKYRLRLLPVAAVYGGNASGKSSLVEAMAAAQGMITTTAKTKSALPIEPFLLDDAWAGRPTRFAFEVLLGETIYAYTFSATKEAVVEEELTEVLSRSERVLFRRAEQQLEVLDPQLEEQSRLKFAFDGTDRNQLFLNNAVSQRLHAFDTIYEWFDRRLHIVGPESHFGPCRHFFTGEHPLAEPMNKLLRQFDTGITELGGQPVAPRDVGMPQSLWDELERDLADGESRSIHPPENRSLLIATKHDGQSELIRQVTRHRTAGGTDVTWDLDRESDGSRRLIDLLPAILQVAASNSSDVLVIDEIDRSMHTLLIRSLLEWYLASRRPDSGAQLIFTTHDAMLMDQALLRRDEMWVTERDHQGASSVFSLSDYQDVRYDKDIRKSYLQGRLGGIPRILLGVSLPAPEEAETLR